MFGFALKVGMTRLFKDGSSIPVTAVRFGNSTIVQTKTKDKDGYDAVQIGSFGKKTTNKAKTGHVKKHAGTDKTFAQLEEFRGVDAGDKKSFSIRDFAEGDLLNVSGYTKGRGFTGVVKRYGFSGQPKSHGHDHERAVGSIGASWPQRVNKGTKMAGRNGNEKETLRSAQVVAIDQEKNLIFIKGSLPGSNGSFLKIKKVVNK